MQTDLTAALQYSAVSSAYEACCSSRLCRATDVLMCWPELCLRICRSSAVRLLDQC